MTPLAITVLIIFLLHIFEEQIWPGGFLVWWNTTVWNSNLPFFPLSEKSNLYINTLGLLIFGVILIILGTLVSAHFFYILFGLMLADAVQHIYFSVSTWKYSPGAYTSILYIALVYLGININTTILHLNWCTIILDLFIGALIIGGSFFISYTRKKKFAFIK